jgi:hypothetical protein
MKYLLSLTLMLLGTGCFADFYTISKTGLFDTSRGTLNKVSVRFKEDNVSMGNAAGHSHTIGAGQQVEFGFTGPLAPLGFTIIGVQNGAFVDPLITTAGGNHTHTFTVPTFSWNGINISLGQYTSNAGGLHSHTVSGLSFAIPPSAPLNVYETGSGSSVSTEDTHSQSFSFDKSIDLTGADLNLFLVGGPSASYTLDFDVPGENHSHQISSGFYVAKDTLNQTLTVNLKNAISLAGSSGLHGVDLTTTVFSTTFDFTPFSAVPEPSSFVLFSVVAGAGAIGRRFLKKRKQV